MCSTGVEVENPASAAVVKAKARNAAGEEYLAKLQAIRRQNYLEKKRIRDKVAKLEGDDRVSPTARAPTPAEETELNARRKKIAALKVVCVLLWWSQSSVGCAAGTGRPAGRAHEEGC